METLAVLKCSNQPFRRRFKSKGLSKFVPQISPRENSVFLVKAMGRIQIWVMSREVQLIPP